MARLFIDGFEGGDTKLWDVVSDVTVVSGPTGRSGSFCLRAFSGYVKKHLAVAKSEVYVGFLLYHDNSQPYDAGMVRFDDAAGNHLARIFIEGADSKITFSTSPSYNPARIAGSTMALNQYTWYLIEVYYKPHDTTGRMVVKVGGVTVIDYTGDTANGTAANVASLRFGDNGWEGNYVYFDDVKIDDDAWPGNSKIVGLLPTANGTTNDMTPSAGSNYQCVDETPASESDYVKSNTTGHKDLYVMGDLPGTGVASIVCVSVEPMAVGMGIPTPTQLKPLVRTGGTNYQGAAKDILAITPKRFQHIWATNPNTGSAWAISEVNGLEAGVELV